MAHSYDSEIEMLRRKGCRLEVVRTYKRYMEVHSDFANGHKGFKTPFLMVIGYPGVGKSFNFKSIEDCKYLTNAASAIGLYRSMFLNRNKQAMILDDIDGLLFDDAAIALLKDAGNTDPVKKICWTKQNQALRKEGIPLVFKSSLRLCLLANECPKPSNTKRGKNIAALIDRVTDFIFFLPIAEEVHQYVKPWIPKEHLDVWDEMGKYLKNLKISIKHVMK